MGKISYEAKKSCQQLDNFFQAKLEETEEED